MRNFRYVKNTDIKIINNEKWCVVEGKMYRLIVSNRNDGLIAAVSNQILKENLSVVLCDKNMTKFVLTTPNYNDKPNAYDHIAYIGEYVTCYLNGNKVGYRDGGGFHSYIKGGK